MYNGVGSANDGEFKMINSNLKYIAMLAKKTKLKYFAKQTQLLFVQPTVNLFNLINRV